MLVIHQININCKLVGKTCYGVELFNHLKNNPEDILKGPFSRRPVPDPDFLSIYLDFGRDVELGIYDNNLTADSVIALRIAFKFFIDGDRMKWILMVSVKRFMVFSM
ncbi:unnamed protein product [Rhizophagus irregularis]|nr:unnamed protein product [Rhizophagus irregularis]